VWCVQACGAAEDGCTMLCRSPRVTGVTGQQDVTVSVGFQMDAAVATSSPARLDYVPDPAVYADNTTCVTQQSDGTLAFTLRIHVRVSTAELHHLLTFTLV